MGKVLAALKTHDLEQSTLVVFTNDNGGQTQTGANNAPLRGRKGQLLEGGIRVPMCMRWPGVIEAGRVVRDPVISLDLLPTFVHAGGGKTPATWALDGVDLGPLLRGDVKALPERPLFWRQRGAEGEIAVRLGSHKLRFADRARGSAAELYDLATDVEEATNLAERYPENVELLTAVLAHWEKQLEAPRWRTRRGGRRTGRPR